MLTAAWPGGIALQQLNRAGRAMIASGVIGLLAFASLFAALYLRETTASQQQWAAGVIQPGIWDAFFRGHDLGVIAQSLLLLPAALAIQRPDARPALSGLPLMSLFGVAALVLLALSLVMVFALKSSDMLYMLPQGFVGVWLIAAVRARPPGLGKALRVLGWVSGLGLVVVGLADIGIVVALGLSPLALVGPMPPQVDPEGVRGALNGWSHAFLDLGSVLGVLTLPVWSILAGRGIARASRAAPTG
jgi:hypothetical protein